MGIFKALGKQGLIDQNFRYDSLEDVLLEADIKAWRHTHKAMKINFWRDITVDLLSAVDKGLDMGVQWRTDRITSDHYTKLSSYKIGYDENEKGFYKTLAMRRTLALLEESPAQIAYKEHIATLQATRDELVAENDPNNGPEVAQLEAIIDELENQVDQESQDTTLTDRIDKLKDELGEYEKNGDDWSLKEEYWTKPWRYDEEFYHFKDKVYEHELSESLAADEHLSNLAIAKNVFNSLQFLTEKLMTYWSAHHQLHADSDGFVGSVKDMILTLNRAGFETKIEGWDQTEQTVIVRKRGNEQKNEKIDLVESIENKYERSDRQSIHTDSTLRKGVSPDDNLKVSVLSDYYKGLPQDKKDDFFKSENEEILTYFLQLPAARGLSTKNQLNILFFASEIEERNYQKENKVKGRFSKKLFTSLLDDINNKNKKDTSLILKSQLDLRALDNLLKADVDKNKKDIISKWKSKYLPELYQLHKKEGGMLNELYSSLEYLKDKNSPKDELDILCLASIDGIDQIQGKNPVESEDLAKIINGINEKCKAGGIQKYIQENESILDETAIKNLKKINFESKEVPEILEKWSESWPSLAAEDVEIEENK